MPVNNCVANGAPELNRLIQNEITYVQRLGSALRPNDGWGGDFAQHFGVPPANFAEATDSYFIGIEVPGIELKDVIVQIMGQHLLLTAFRKPVWTFGATPCGFQLAEGCFGAMQRSFLLPPDANTTGIQGQCGQGLLLIVIPRNPSLAHRSSALQFTNITINAGFPTASH